MNTIREHPEPWTVESGVKDPSDAWVTVFDANRNIVSHEDCNEDEMPNVLVTARRIVVTVNFCRGVKTDVMQQWGEVGIVRTMEHFAYAMIDSLCMFSKHNRPMREPMKYNVRSELKSRFRVEELTHLDQETTCPEATQCE